MYESITDIDGEPFDDEYVSRCPACGDVSDYCQGHGEIGDPNGRAIIDKHDEGYHWDCHPQADCRSMPRGFTFPNGDTLIVEPMGVHRTTDDEDRPVYRIQLRTANWEYVDDSLCGPTDSKSDALAGAEAAVCFIASAGDGSADIAFPEHVLEWAREHTNELDRVWLTLKPESA